MDERIQQGFKCFARNERWGTCVDCPMDSESNIYPELCSNTDRYDHNLNVDMLCSQYLNEWRLSLK